MHTYPGYHQDTIFPLKPPYDVTEYDRPPVPQPSLRIPDGLVSDLPEIELLQQSVEARLNTFHGWPSSCPVKTKDLADAGLYYQQEGDRVHCAFCRGTMYNWAVGDTPMGEHRRHFPYCSFVIEHDQNTNFQSQHFQPFAQVNNPDVLTNRQMAPPNYDDIRQHPLLTTGIPQNTQMFPNNPDVRPMPSRNPIQQGISNERQRAEHTARNTTNELERERTPYAFVGVQRFVPTPGSENLVAQRELVETQPPEVGRSRGSKPTAPPPQPTWKDSYAVKAVLSMNYPEGDVKKAYDNVVRKLLAINAENIIDELFELESNIAETSDAVTHSNQNVGPTETATTQPELQSQDLPGYATSEASSSEPTEASSSSVHESAVPVEPRSTSVSEPAAPVDARSSPTHGRVVPVETMHEVSGNLLRQIEQLERENDHLKQNSLCNICMDADISVLFLPCKHFITCATCAGQLMKCPLCRKHVSQKLSVYRG